MQLHSYLPRTLRAAAFLLLAVVPALAQHHRMAPDLEAVDDNKDLDVIVQYYVSPTHSDEQVASKHGHLAKVMNNMHQVHLKKRDLQKILDENPNVMHVSPDRDIKGFLDVSGPTIGADVARSLGYDGTGIGVAVIDSGITSTADLNVAGSSTSRMVYSQNFAPGTNTTADLYGHGTHVAGIVGGNGANSTCSSCTITYRGIAPNVKIINLRALDANGTAKDSTVITAIQKAIALKSTYNIRVINLSLGRGVYESYTLDPLCQAVEQAWKAGIVVVVASGNYGRDNSFGNYGYGTIAAPANDPYVITVGAMNTRGTQTRADDMIATYSSKGPSNVDWVVKPDIVAPGNLITSLLASTSDTLYTAHPGNAVKPTKYKPNALQTATPKYYQLSGTSMAAPMVSGAVALMLQKTPDLTPDQVKARLMKSAYKVFPQYTTYTDTTTGVTYWALYDIFTVGAGYLDIASALSNTDLAPTTVGAAKSPRTGYDPVSGTIYMVSDSSVLWGNSVLWGASVVWGSSVIWGSTATGQSVLWGTSVPNIDTDSFSVLWGTSVMWGASTDASAKGVETGGDHF